MIQEYAKKRGSDRNPTLSYIQISYEKPWQKYNSMHPEKMTKIISFHDLSVMRTCYFINNDSVYYRLNHFLLFD
jgi:hypothetical protein